MGGGGKGRSVARMIFRVPLNGKSDQRGQHVEIKSSQLGGGDRPSPESKFDGDYRSDGSRFNLANPWGVYEIVDPALFVTATVPIAGALNGVHTALAVPLSPLVVLGQPV